MSTTTAPIDHDEPGVVLPHKRSGAQAGPMDEETRLASSDLDDCQEVWLPELGDYILETKKRQNQVAQYFWASILVSLFSARLSLARC